MKGVIEGLRALIIKFRRFITFGFVGIINTLVDFAAFSLCRELLRLAPATAQAVGYLAGVVCSFTLNRTVTFRDWTSRFWEQAALFALVNAAGLLISTYLMERLTLCGLNAYFSKIVVTALVMGINYFSYKLLVFRVKNRKKEMNGDE